MIPKRGEGQLGYLRAGKDAMMKKMTILKDVDIDPSGYDLVVLGTPVWSWTMPAPIRTYIRDHKDKLGKVAFFITCGMDSGKSFKHMEKDIGKKPIATLEIFTKEVKKDEYMDKVKDFTEKLK